MKAEKHLGQSLSMVLVLAIASLGMVALIAVQSGAL